MGDIVNLNQFRKKREREERSAESAKKSTRATRSEAERKAAAQENERSVTRLEGKRVERDDDPPCEPDNTPEPA